MKYVKTVRRYLPSEVVTYITPFPSEENSGTMPSLNRFLRRPAAAASADFSDILLSLAVAVMYKFLYNNILINNFLNLKPCQIIHSKTDRWNVIAKVN